MTMAACFAYGGSTMLSFLEVQNVHNHTNQ